MFFLPVLKEHLFFSSNFSMPGIIFPSYRKIPNTFWTLIPKSSNSVLVKSYIFFSRMAIWTQQQHWFMMQFTYLHWHYMNWIWFKISISIPLIVQEKNHGNMEAPLSTTWNWQHSMVWVAWFNLILKVRFFKTHLRI